MIDNYVEQLNTGNEFISLPNISAADAAVDRIGFIHKAFRSCIELRGTADCPILKPVLELDGEELFEGHPESELVSFWMPRFTVSTPRIVATATIFAPLERRGFAYVLSVQNTSQTDVTFKAGWKGCWDSSHISANMSRMLSGTRHASVSSWREGVPVIEFRGQTPLFAMALVSQDIMPVRLWNGDSRTEITQHSQGSLVAPDGAPIRYEMVDDFVVKASETIHIPIYVGIGLEEVSAVASAQELRMQGWDRMYNSLKLWLDKRTIECDDRYFMRMINMNSFYNYFYSQGTTLDSEELVLTTSRNSDNDHCGAYLDRDAMRWSLPAILQISWSQARMGILHAFTNQLPNVGVHARFVDGIVLEPGLQLDQLCAPVRALTIYVKLTGDMSILFDRRVQVGVNTIQQILAAQRHPEVALFETLLLPSGKHAEYPYICFSNMLVWRVLRDICWLYDHIRDLDRAEEAMRLANQVHEAIKKHFIVNGPNGKMYARGIDMEGGFEIGDDPEGSLQLMTYFEFCNPSDSVYKNTVEWIHSDKNPLSRNDGPFKAPSVEGGAGPSILSVVNDLLTGRTEQAFDFLRRAKLDNGIGCETVDANTGKAINGKAFASCAGYLAFALRGALNALSPQTAVVEQKRRPSETLYQPPPEMSHDTKKARM